MGARAEPPFEVPLRRSLRRAGLRGSTAEVRLQGDTLILSGAEGGSLAIPPSAVECLRIASYSSRHVPPDYEFRIWRAGERGSLVIATAPRRHGSYGPVMREFAGWVFADGGRVLRGPGLLRLIVQMIWTVGTVALFALVLLGGAIAEGKWWMWLITLFVAGLAVLLFVGLYRTSWPRRVTSPEQLDEMLPAREEVRRR